MSLDSAALGAIISKPGFEAYSVFIYSGSLPTNPAEQLQASRLSHAYLLQYAIERVRDAAVDFSWNALVENLNQPDRAESLVKEIHNHLVSEHGDKANNSNEKFLVRAAFESNGTLSLMSQSLGPWNDASLYYPTTLPQEAPAAINDRVGVNPVYLDPGKTVPSLLTKHKTPYRNHYNASLERIGLKPGAKAAIIWQNDRGEVAGSVYETVYFFRQGSWVTPRSESGCKQSITRRWALEHAGVREAMIRADELQEGELIWLSSAVGGFKQGRITLAKPAE